jgi:hypothetical protein
MGERDKRPSLRSFAASREHVATHNWFAVGIELPIVVVGVFIGMRVTNGMTGASSTRKDLVSQQADR